MASEHFDIAIIGGGPAGAIAAGQLAAEGLRVLLADAQGDAQFKPGDGLPPAAKRILNECGVWQDFLAQGHIESFGTRSAWGSPEIQSNDFIRSPDGMGYHLDRTVFDSMLRAYAQKQGAIVRMETPLKRFEKKDGKWILIWEKGEGENQTTCQFLVEATGRARKILRNLQIPFQFHDQQICFYRAYRLKPDSEHDWDATALVESVAGGWWYSARLPRSQRIVMMFCDAGTQAAKALQTTDGFDAQLEKTRHIHKELMANTYEPAGPPVGTDARTGCAQTVVGEGWCAIGDAALAFDPLSSQGLLTAMYAGLRVKDGIIQALSGDYSGLETYADNLNAIFETFLANQNRFYEGERRWKNQPFWKARQRNVKDV